MAMQKEAEEKQQQQLQTDVSARSKGVNVPIIWVLGGPGCGKGTQCAKIVEKYHFAHISTGDLLRAEVASGSDKGKELAAIMKEGRLVPNSDVLQLLEAAICQCKDATGFLIDGYPREKDQGAAFEKFVAPVDLVLFFDCADGTLVARILHRAAQSAVTRADDNEETLKCRIETFRKNTMEILNQYKEKTLIINAERSVDEIFQEVDNSIANVVEKKKVAVQA